MMYGVGHDPYKMANSCHPPKPAKITIAAPVNENPSSIKSVRNILEEIQSRLPEDIKWVTVWSDGVPYVYGSQLQVKLFYCNVCKEIIDASEEGINLHPHPHWTKHFSDILLRPGPGHIEINMARVLLDYLWVPLIEDV